MFNFDAEASHEHIIVNQVPKLAYSERKDFDAWRKELRVKFTELLGINKIRENDCPLNVIVEYREKKEGYELIRLVIETEKDVFIPCYLLIPDGNKEKYPLAITLQGHKSGGMYNSIGIVKDDDDREYQPRGAFALQAVKEGFAALCVEMRGMGELESVSESRNKGFSCRFASVMAISLGRSVIGERVWDISKAIDAMEKFPQVDLSTIVITGNSGGGTASFYAGAYDERITLTAPSCAFCSYSASILHWFHCFCNVIPEAPRYFDMGDLAGLIAPRKLTIIAGALDDVFPYQGVLDNYPIVERIYERVGAKGNAELVTTPKNHWWCEDIVWPSIQRGLKK